VAEKLPVRGKFYTSITLSRNRRLLVNV